MQNGDTNRLDEKLKNLPTQPGIYLYKNKRGRVIYVGKAKNLRNRVRSYFQKSHTQHPKTTALVAEIDDLDLITTQNELEALILENSLIKTEKPKFNITLRDDKDWLYLKLSVEEEFPRVTLIRRPDKSAGLVYGPYIPAYLARKMKALLHKYFGVRNCGRTITGEDPRACLQYDMGRCCGPCIKKSAWDEYKTDITRAKMLLEGKNRELITELKEAMQKASSHQLYEKAAGYRDAVDVVQRHGEEQRIASTGFEEQDVFAYHYHEEKAVLILFAVRNGLVKSKKEFAWENMSPEDVAELLPTTIQQFYHGISYIPKNILIQSDFESRELLEEWLTGVKGSKVQILVPQRGKKISLLRLALENAHLAWKSRFTISDSDALGSLQNALSLPELPRHIECFDISNIQGTDKVASMVYWKDGKSRKSEYRKYKIKTVEGVDDFASMQEVVERRYTRLVREDKPLPDLVLIDGGKGQLSAAVTALENAGVADLPVASIAKREEIIYTPINQQGIKLKKSDAALKLIQRIRDEAHRFAITFHRSKRTQRTISTTLKRIPGIGAKRAKTLLVKFGSLERIRNTDAETLASVVGEKQASIIKEYLKINQ